MIRLKQSLAGAQPPLGKSVSTRAPNTLNLAHLPTMDVVSTSDAMTLISLLATAADPAVEMPVAARQRELLNGLQTILSADAWLWFAGEVRPSIGADSPSSGLLYEGFQNEQDPIEILQSVCRPLVEAAFTPEIPQGRADETPAVLVDINPVNGNGRGPTCVKACDVFVGDHITSLKCCPRDGTYSGVSFHRRNGRPAFSSRERALVEMLFQQVAWLHSTPTEASLTGGLALLSPREREVMCLLLDGQTRKDVARQLMLSTHTVADYFKQIYAKLDVSSRAELMARFIHGNR
jgi:DNA-binding CsgD family transcriptional regulator